MSKTKKSRIPIIDFIRGLAIINMVIYHLLFSLVFIFNVKIPFFSLEKFYPYQQYIAWSFILVSGFSINLSRRPLKNGIKILIASLLITIVTYFVVKDFAIYFGVLHFLGLSTVIVSLIKKQLKAINPLIGTLISFLIFFIIWHKTTDIIPFSHLFEKMNLFVLGFPNDSFYSSDFFPLLPWFFLYLTGLFIGRLNEEDTINLESIKIRSRFLEFLSRNSLIIYLSHQVVIFLGLTILRKIGII